VGAALIGGVVAASRASASGQTLTVSPHVRLKAGENVIVRGTGFIHGSVGGLLECNDYPGEPATEVLIHGLIHAIPVGCTAPLWIMTSATGTLGPVRLIVGAGTLGAWETGTDSAGNQAAADSVSYPCPPTAAQASVGVSCVFEFLDNKGQVATHSVNFKSPGGGTTTTTATTTTVVTTTTTTTNPCTAQSVSVTASPPDGTATVTVDPGTCLLNGTVATISATGLMAASISNFIGSFVECNSDPGQPTITVLSHVIPVSCTSASADTFTPNAGGTVDAPFTIIGGTTGPPATGLDSAGNQAGVDAANYPCPPTAAQVTAGDTCDLQVSDSGGDLVEVPLSFDPGV